MIKELSLLDEELYNKLGLEINKNFINLFPLEKILDNDNEYIYGYYKDNNLIGFIHISKSYETIDIINIIVKREERRNKIATKLLDYIVDKYKDINNIMLEVRSKNDIAIKFYLNNKFKHIHTRENYYEDDDAYIMKRDVI